MTNVVIDEGGIVDVVRLEELERLKQLKNLEHWESADCWCFPTLVFRDPETGSCVFKHYLPH